MRTRVTFYSLIFFLLWQNAAFSQSAALRGQLSGWLIANDQDPLISQIGIQYIPELTVEHEIGSQFMIDAEASARIYGTIDFNDERSTDTEGELKVYRLWGRFSSNQFESRLGLQKINFGSATLFRPLRWFDRIDPRDPLQITEGVYALLLRYYFQNNANIWLWGLYGNDDPKGREIAPTADNTVEFGGRVQVPLYTGEVALSYHHRQADFSQLSILVADEVGDDSVGEDRLGLDGKWDVGVGIWFEGAIVRHQTDIPGLKYQRALTVGIDYTFGIGNGLNVLGEHNITDFSDSAFGSGEGGHISGLSANYPLGLIDKLSTIVSYDWDNNDWYRTLTWQRQYDNWNFFAIGFWNPDEFMLAPDVDRDNNFSGKGVQLMVVFNH